MEILGNVIEDAKVHKQAYRVIMVQIKITEFVFAHVNRGYTSI